MDCQEQGALHDVIRHYEMWRHRIVRELKVPFSITSSTIAQYSVGPFHSTSCDPTNALLRQSKCLAGCTSAFNDPRDRFSVGYCWTQTRWRYRAKGDPRFYYAPKGHTLETSHDTKPQPKKPPKRTVFPTLAELPNINLHQLYVEMKPESSGRNAFKRKWKRWRQSMVTSPHILFAAHHHLTILRGIKQKWSRAKRRQSRG